MYPKKKNGRLARLGEQPLHSKYKNEGGERFGTQKTPPPPSFKRKNTKACGSCPLKPLLVAFCFHFWCYYSLPTSKCNFPWLFGSPLMCFGVLVAHFLQNLWSSSHVNSCLIVVNWGVVGDGPRPTLHFEATGHAALPPFSCNLCPNVRPPSARWNAPMIYEYDFAKFGWWDCFIYVETA